MFYIYSLPGCTWCDKAKEFLRERNERYYEINEKFVVYDILRKYNRTTVPTIFYYNGPDEKLPGLIGGFNELERWYEENVKEGPLFPKERNADD